MLIDDELLAHRKNLLIDFIVGLFSWSDRFSRLISPGYLKSDQPCPQHEEPAGVFSEFHLAFALPRLECYVVGSVVWSEVGQSAATRARLNSS